MVQAQVSGDPELLQRAVAVLRAGVQARPRDPAALADLGAALVTWYVFAAAAGDLAEAGALFDRARAAVRRGDPQLAPVLSLVGSWLALTAETAAQAREAVRVLRRAVAVNSPTR